MGELDPEELRRLYWGDGLTVGEVTRRLSVSARRVRSAMAAHGIPARPAGARRAIADIDEVVRRYEAGETIAEIAGALGVGGATVQRARARRGVAMRPASRRAVYPALTAEHFARNRYIAYRVGRRQTARILKTPLHRLNAYFGVWPRSRGTRRRLYDPEVRACYETLLAEGLTPADARREIGVMFSCGDRTVRRSLARSAAWDEYAAVRAQCLRPGEEREPPFAYPFGPFPLPPRRPSES